MRDGGKYITFSKRTIVRLTGKELSSQSEYVEPILNIGVQNREVSTCNLFIFKQLKRIERLPIRRMTYGMSAIVLLFTILTPAVQFVHDRLTIQLDEQVSRLLDVPSKKLSDKITYDAQKKVYTFNEKQKAVESPKAGPENVPESVLKSQVTGKDGSEKPLYSVDMPERIEDGFRYYDNNLKVSFKMVPVDQKGKGGLVNGHLVYDLADNRQAVFTTKSNGIKEDIILHEKPNEDQLSFQYKLELPKTLEARLLDDGGLGIYSVDPTLLGNITYGSDADREKIESARINGEKNHLVFGIPAPVIKESNDGNHALAKFLLTGNTLTVYATGLHGARYPLSIDPTVVVTSIADFEEGKNEDSIEFTQTGELNRFELTGGSLEDPVEGAGMTTSRDLFDGLSYNGYIYAVGDWTTPGERSFYDYAKIGADHSIGTWTKLQLMLTTGGALNPGIGFSMTSYNGYAYITGGTVSGGDAPRNTVYYAKFNSDGTLGTWNLSPQTFSNARYWHESLAYNGYLYIAGGRIDSADGNDIFPRNDVMYSKINADGSIGSWQATTSFTGPRSSFGLQIYNGWFYVYGGVDYDNSPILNPTALNLTSVSRSRINSDGTISAFIPEGNLPQTHRFGQSTVINGYLYLTSGDTSSPFNMYYAPLMASGSIGSWAVAHDTFTTRVGSVGTVGYNGYLYTYGGNSGSTEAESTGAAYYTKPKDAGEVNAVTAGTNITTARMGASVVAYNGYLYMMGGYDGVLYQSDVQRATISDTGVVGAWSSVGMPTFSSGRAYMGTAIAVGATTGRVYVTGGLNTTNTLNEIVSATISADGSMSAWTAADSTLNGRRSHHHTLIRGNYIYVVAGKNSSGVAMNSVQYATLAGVNIDHGIADDGWANTGNLAVGDARWGHGAVMYGHTIYIAGGYNGTSYFADVQYNAINSDGTLSTWTSAGNALSVARSGLSLVALKGYLYAFGGATGASEGTGSTLIEKTRIKNDRTVDAWTTSGALPAARSYMGADTRASRAVLVAGDESGTKRNTSYVVQLNNGGRETTSTWTASSSFTSGVGGASARQYHGTAAYNGYLYITGGNTSGSNYTTDVQYAPLNPDGSVGTWATTSALPVQLFGHDSFAYGGYLYTVGGNSLSAYYAKINSDGTLQSWATTGSAFASLRHFARTAVYNGRVYVTGGVASLVSGDASAQVSYATINNNGTLSSWVAGTSLPDDWANHSSFANNGYLYVGGGRSTTLANGTGAIGSIRYAQINANGSIGSWSTNYPNPLSAWGNRYVSANGFLYLFGSTNGAKDAWSSAVFVTTFKANGEVDDTNWDRLPSRVETRWNYGAAVYNGTMYVTGGESDTSVMRNTTEYASLHSIGRVSRYSKLINGLVPIDLQSIQYTGTLSDGLNSISYRVAGSNAVLGDLTSAKEIVPSSLTPCSLTPISRYVYVKATLDDSYMYAAYPDSAQTNRGSIQDLNVTYANVFRPSPANRLFQGKSFAQSMLLPYDTCNL